MKLMSSALTVVTLEVASWRSAIGCAVAAPADNGRAKASAARMAGTRAEPGLKRRIVQLLRRCDCDPPFHHGRVPRDPMPSGALPTITRATGPVSTPTDRVHQDLAGRVMAESRVGAARHAGDRERMTIDSRAREARLAAEPLRPAGPRPGFIRGTVQSLRDIAGQAELLSLLVRRELKARYKDSI